MSLVHERRFRVRHYECDAAGWLYYAAYLRYLQETAMGASAAAGYDVARFTTMDRQWLVRETELAIRRPLRYDETVIIRTYVEWFRRIHSRRRYELRLEPGGDPVATAYTDWVYIDTARGRPTSIPPALIAALFPDGDPPEPPRHARFPEPGDPPADAFTVQRRVQWGDLDMARHVNNAQYAMYIEDALADHMAAQDWTLDRLAAIGLDLTARRWWLDYRQPATFDDRLAITTWLVPAAADVIQQRVTISRPADGASLVRAYVDWVWVDPAQGVVVPPPAGFVAGMGQG